MCIRDSSYLAKLIPCPNISLSFAVVSPLPSVLPYSDGSATLLNVVVFQCLPFDTFNPFGSDLPYKNHRKFWVLAFYGSASHTPVNDFCSFLLPCSIRKWKYGHGDKNRVRDKGWFWLYYPQNMKKSHFSKSVCAVSYTHLDVYKRQVFTLVTETFQRASVWYINTASAERKTDGSVWCTNFFFFLSVALLVGFQR